MGINGIDEMIDKDWHIINNITYTPVGGFIYPKQVCSFGGTHCVRYEDSGTAAHPPKVLVCIKCGMTVGELEA